MNREHTQNQSRKHKQQATQQTQERRKKNEVRRQKQEDTRDKRQDAREERRQKKENEQRTKTRTLHREERTRNAEHGPSGDGDGNGDNINVDVYIDVDDDVVIVRILVVGDDDEPGASRGVEGDPGPWTGLERLLSNVIASLGGQPVSPETQRAAPLCQLLIPPRMQRTTSLVGPPSGPARDGASCVPGRTAAPVREPTYIAY